MDAGGVGGGGGRVVFFCLSTRKIMTAPKMISKIPMQAPPKIKLR